MPMSVRRDWRKYRCFRAPAPQSAVLVSGRGGHSSEVGVDGSEADGDDTDKQIQQVRPRAADIVHGAIEGPPQPMLPGPSPSASEPSTPTSEE